MIIAQQFTAGIRSEDIAVRVSGRLKISLKICCAAVRFTDSVLTRRVPSDKSLGHFSVVC